MFKVYSITMNFIVIMLAVVILMSVPLVLIKYPITFLILAPFAVLGIVVCAIALAFHRNIRLVCESFKLLPGIIYIKLLSLNERKAA